MGFGLKMTGHPCDETMRRWPGLEKFSTRTTLPQAKTPPRCRGPGRSARFAIGRAIVRGPEVVLGFVCSHLSNFGRPKLRVEMRVEIARCNKRNRIGPR